jgi:hypothetical protein
MKHTSVAERLSVWRASFQFEGSSVKQDEDEYAKRTQFVGGEAKGKGMVEKELRRIRPSGL